MPEFREPALSVVATIVVTRDGQALRNARLVALRTSPESFLSRYETEAGRPAEWWRRELARGDWLIAVLDGAPVGLLGVTREPDAADDERFLSYLWVHPQVRRSGLATTLLTTALDRLRGSGVARVWLWVLDGNHAAWRLYEHLGFGRTGQRQLLPGHPAGYEERLALDIT